MILIISIPSLTWAQLQYRAGQQIQSTEVDFFITFLSSSYRNLMHLIGLPASYMNRILFRYHQNEIPDLITFLESPWATALYHESFPLMREELKSFGLQSPEFQKIQESFKGYRESDAFHKLSSQMVRAILFQHHDHLF